MQFLHRSLLLVCLFSLFTGCASTVQERKDFFSGLSPDRVTPSRWAKLTGNYFGSIRSTADSPNAAAFVEFAGVTGDVGVPGVTITMLNIRITGTPEEPLVYLKMDASYSSSFIPSGNYTETYTNIKERQYGVRRHLLAYSHAPNQLLISLEPELFSPNRGAALILTFRPDGLVNVDCIGHFGRTGSGLLRRSISGLSRP